MASPNLKGNKMSIKNLVGKKITKEVKFMGESVTINKLSVSEVLDIQVKAKELEGNDTEGFTLLKSVIRSAVQGAEELSNEDFDTFPMDELSKLSNEIMKFSGLNQDQGK